MTASDIRSCEGRIVAICAPFGRDAAFLAAVVEEQGYVAKVCLTLDLLSPAINDDAGLLLVTEESLQHDTARLRAAFLLQPAWSDLPVLFLAAPSSVKRSLDSVRTRLPDFLASAIVLERPLSRAALTSTLRAALRSRARQFQTRDAMLELSAGRFALAQSERELRLVTDSLPVLIAFIDRDLVYRFANRAYEDWFYCSPHAIVGRRAVDVLGLEAYALREPAMRDALAGRPTRLELSWPHRDGRRREAEIRYLPRTSDGGIVDGFHVFVLDVTDRKMNEEQLEARVSERTAALTAEMETRARAEAELRQSQKMEAVGQLTGGIAHDFNNMLTGVTGSLEIVKRRMSKGKLDDIERFMDSAIQSAQRAAALTSRLLAFSRRQTLDTRPVDVNQLLYSLEELLRRSIRENIALRLLTDDGLPQALVDANQLENAIINLVVNARDAMPDGGRLTLSTHSITITSDSGFGGTRLPHGQYVAITVADSGVGMPAYVLEKIFDPFFTTKPVGQGTGLGMSMVYGFVRQSGGEVRVRSEPDKGTEVTLLLRASEEAMEAAAAQAATESPEGEGQSVLIVEDDPSVRLLMREVLEELRYRVFEAALPSEAIKQLSSMQSIDLLVTDVGLPEMNGRQLAEIARSLRADLPILFVTGYAENAMLKAEFVGTNMAMITKPFSVDLLAKKVAEMLAGEVPRL